MNAELRFFVDGIEQTPRAVGLPSSFNRGDQICLAGQRLMIVDVVHHLSDERFTIDVHASASRPTASPELLVDDLLRYHVLMRVFDGDVSRWLEFLENEASPGQIAADAPFVEWLAGALCEDPALMDRIRELVETTGELLFGFVNSDDTTGPPIRAYAN